MPLSVLVLCLVNGGIFFLMQHDIYIYSSMQWYIHWSALLRKSDHQEAFISSRSPGQPSLGTVTGRGGGSSSILLNDS